MNKLTGCFDAHDCWGCTTLLDLLQEVALPHLSGHILLLLCYMHLVAHGHTLRICLHCFPNAMLGLSLNTLLLYRCHHFPVHGCPLCYG